jgi:hypothetical protein
MAIPVSLAGSTFNLPEAGDVDWQSGLTRWMTTVNSTLVSIQGGGSTFGQDWTNVMSYGATGLGVVSDATAITNAQSASAASGVIAFPPGTYLAAAGAMSLRAPTGTTFKGSNAYTTTIKASGGSGPLFQTSVSFARDSFIFENITFDCNSTATAAIAAYGDHVESLVIRNCIFKVAGSQGISLSGVRDVLIENCTFYGAAAASGAGIAVGSGAERITIRNCRFEYCQGGISVDTGVIVSTYSSAGGMVRTGGNTVTVTTKAAHGLSPGCAVYVSADVTADANFPSGWKQVVTGSGTTFTYTETGSNSTSATVYNIGTVAEDIVEFLDVDGCYFDGGWWLWPSLKSNSGGTVTYTANSTSGSGGFPVGSLADTAGGFNALTLTQVATPIRVLIPNHGGSNTSTLTTVGTLFLTDSAGSFIARKVKRGDIVRCGTKFTTVRAVQSATKLRLDGWVDSTSYEPVAPPSAAATYTLYKTLIGHLALTANSNVAIAGLTRSGSTVTCTTTAPHAFQIGQIVYVAPTGTVDANYPAGVKTILTTPTTSSFTYTEAGTTSASTTAYSVTNKADTVLNTYDGWFDTDGTAADVSGGSWLVDGVTYSATAGTLYEIARNGLYSGIHVEYGARMVRVRGSTFRRSQADQISIYSNSQVVTGNMVEDGQDMGITINGTPDEGHALVANNRIDHQGTSGIYIGTSRGSLVANNVITNTSWSNHASQVIPGILIDASHDVLIQGNVIDGGGRTLSRTGIMVGGDAYPCTRTHLIGNIVRRVSSYGILLYGALATGTKLRDNEATIFHYTALGGVPAAGAPVGGGLRHPQGGRPGSHRHPRDFRHRRHQHSIHGDDRETVREREWDGRNRLGAQITYVYCAKLRIKQVR